MIVSFFIRHENAHMHQGVALLLLLLLLFLLPLVFLLLLLFLLLVAFSPSCLSSAQCSDCSQLYSWSVTKLQTPSGLSASAVCVRSYVLIRIGVLHLARDGGMSLHSGTAMSMRSCGWGRWRGLKGMEQPNQAIRWIRSLLVSCWSIWAGQTVFPRVYGWDSSVDTTMSTSLSAQHCACLFDC